MLVINDICAALDRAGIEGGRFTPDSSHAAVAMILCPGPHELEMCFIRRAEKVGDRWSGQVALPGGRASAGDADAPAVAERETHEEIGLALRRAQRIGALPEVVIDRSARGLRLSPFVYHLNSRPSSLRANEEVAAIFWVPLSHLFAQENTTELEWGGSGSYPGIQFADHVIWGLTLRVLGSFAEIVGHRLPALEN
ncbi:MAG: CoA pyrophosphatase [Gammaproteobacteria bacterium]|nr:CoA pyrophosphatase [Gammaproteobacteria bacterium]